MKVLVTGANGQLGRCLQDCLESKRAEGRAIDCYALARAELDITDSAAVDAWFAEFQPDVVINAAAYTSVDKAETEHEQAAKINENGPANLAQACARNESLLIHVSTDYVFDGQGSEPYTPESIAEPLGVYGATKLAGEHRIQQLCNRYCIVRTSWVFSEYGANFLKTMLRLANERDSLSIVADQHGTPTYAADLADALVDIACGKHSEQRSGVYHFSGGDVTTWHGFANAIFQSAFAMGAIKSLPQVEAISSDQFPTTAKRPMYSVLSGQQLADAFGIGAGDWRKGMEQALDRLANG